MPYMPRLSPETVHAVGRYLVSVAVRPRETETDDAVVRIDRKTLWDQYGAASPVARFEDFYEALRLIADETDGLQIVDGSARRVNIILSCDAEEWEELFYEDYPYDDIDHDEVREYLAAQHYDVTTPTPDAHRVMPRARNTFKHDPDVPRTCTRCEQTKPTDQFYRRGREGSPLYHRFGSVCRDCLVVCTRDYRRKNPGVDSRTRHERLKGAPRRDAYFF